MSSEVNETVYPWPQEDLPRAEPPAEIWGDPYSSDPYFPDPYA
jgi:hypothetical protein